MGDLDLSGAFSGITTDALLEALFLVVLASILIMLVQNLLPRLAHTLGGKPRLYLLASVPLLRLVVIVVTIILVVSGSDTVLDWRWCGSCCGVLPPVRRERA